MKSTKKRSSFSMQETDEAEEENEDLSDRQKQIREGGAVVWDTIDGRRARLGLAV